MLPNTKGASSRPAWATKGMTVVCSTILTAAGLESTVSDDLARKKFTELKDRAGQRR